MFEGGTRIVAAMGQRLVGRVAGETTSHGGDERQKLLANGGVAEALHICLIVDVSSGGVVGKLVAGVGGDGRHG